MISFIIIIIISSPFWIIVELITKSFDIVPVDFLIQRVGGPVCVNGKHIRLQSASALYILKLLLVRDFYFNMHLTKNMT